MILIKEEKKKMQVVSEKITHLQGSLLENLKILLQLITLRFKRQKGLKSPMSHITFQRRNDSCALQVVVCYLCTYREGQVFLHQSSSADAAKICQLFLKHDETLKKGKGRPSATH